MVNDDYTSQLESVLYDEHLRRPIDEMRKAHLLKVLRVTDDGKKILADLLKRKADGAKAMECPPFDGAGTVIADIGVKPEFLNRKFLVWTRGQAKSDKIVKAVIPVDSILAGDITIDEKLKHRTALYRFPGDDRGTFEYLLSLVRRVISGELKPGKVVTVTSVGHKFSPHLQSKDARDTLFGDRDGQMSRIRAPWQSQEEFDEADAAIQEKIDAERNSNAMKPANRTQYAMAR